MGVRDALRMVDSFNKWAQRNPGRAKSIDDFIHDGLIAAAKRCESCLKEQLGLSFVKKMHEEDVTTSFDSEKTDEETLLDIMPPPDDVFSASSDAFSDTEFEITVEPKEIESDEEIAIESEEPPLSVDSVERIDNEVMDDMFVEGTARDFSTDFELIEPSPLEIESEDVLTDESDSDEESDESARDEASTIDEPKSEQEVQEESPAFTWSDYEAAVTPAHTPEPSESDYNEETEESDESFESSTEEEPLSEQNVNPPYPPPSVSQEWDSDHGNVLIDNELQEDLMQDEDDTLHEKSDSAESESEEETTHITEPPSPPPPPESEEDEEERRRRARRLFFGT
jgi:hypothetical protein